LSGNQFGGDWRFPRTVRSDDSRTDCALPRSGSHFRLSHRTMLPRSDASRRYCDPGPKPLAAQDLAPATDHGTLPNLCFSLDEAHMRLERGWPTRQATGRELGVSKNILYYSRRYLGRFRAIRSPARHRFASQLQPQDDGTNSDSNEKWRRVVGVTLCLCRG
jgi:hypothetical protein